MLEGDVCLSLLDVLGEGASVEVDYMKAGNVKKPANGKPGLVIYHSNWSCTVTPDAEKIQKMKEKEK